MTTVNLTIKFRLAWWTKALIPVWFVQVLFGFKPWVPRSAIVVDTDYPV